MPGKADELRFDYARLVSQMRELNDAADGEERDFTAEEEQEYTRLEAEASTTREKLLREQQLRERELGIESGAIDPRGLSQDQAAQVTDATEIYGGVFMKYMTQGRLALSDEERSVLQTGWRRADADQKTTSDAIGGYIVPQEFQNQLIEFLTIQSVLRLVPTTKIVTSTGRDMLLPRLTDTGEAFWVAEATALTPSPVQFDQVNIGAHKNGRIVTISQELLEDAAFDIAGILASKIGGSIGQLEGAAYMNGTGTGQPEGILHANGAAQGAETAVATAIEADDLIDLFYSVPSPYSRNGTWVVADDALPAIRKLKDGNERYLLDVAAGPSLVGSPAVDLLLGRPVFVSPDFPGTALSAGAKIALFGDFSVYWIRDVGTAGPTADETGGGSFTVRRLDERYAEMGVVGFLAFHRTDGKYLGDDNAVKYLKCKGT